MQMCKLKNKSCACKISKEKKYSEIFKTQVIDIILS